MLLPRFWVHIMGSRFSMTLSLWHVFMTLIVGHVVRPVQLSMAVGAWKLLHDLVTPGMCMPCGLIIFVIRCFTYYVFHVWPLWHDGHFLFVVRLVFIV